MTEKWVQRCEVGLGYLSISQLTEQILWFSGNLQFLSQAPQWDEWFIKKLQQRFFTFKMNTVFVYCDGNDQLPSRSKLSESEMNDSDT